MFQYEAEFNAVTFKPKYKELIGDKFCFQDDFTLNFELVSDILGPGTVSFDVDVEADTREDSQVILFEFDHGFDVNEAVAEATGVEYV